MYINVSMLFIYMYTYYSAVQYVKGKEFSFP